MTTHRLIAKDGTLYFPPGGDEDMLARFYDAGDMDTIPWPLKSPYRDAKTLRKDLAIALYAERECRPSDEFKDGDVIELPDGSVFDFDKYVP